MRITLKNIEKIVPAIEATVKETSATQSEMYAARYKSQYNDATANNLKANADGIQQTQSLDERAGNVARAAKSVVARNQTKPKEEMGIERVQKAAQGFTGGGKQ